MTPTEVVKRVAEMLGIPEATLVVQDRNLVVAGLRSKQEKGRGAGNITARDAAHLLTAALGSNQAKDAVPAVRRYSETRAQNPGSVKRTFAQMGLKELASLPPDHSFVDALEALLHSASVGALGKWMSDVAQEAGAPKAEVAPLIEVAFLSPGTLGDLRVAGMKDGLTAAVRYALPSPWDRPGRKKPSEAEIAAWEKQVHARHVDVDLEQYRKITARTILHIAEGLSPRKEN